MRWCPFMKIYTFIQQFHSPCSLCEIYNMCSVSLLIGNARSWKQITPTNFGQELNLHKLCQLSYKYTQFYIRSDPTILYISSVMDQTPHFYTFYILWDQILFLLLPVPVPKNLLHFLGLILSKHPRHFSQHITRSCPRKVPGIYCSYSFNLYPGPDIL